MKSLILASVLVACAGAQTWDTSGNSLLQGNYYFRNVIWLIGDESGSLGRAISLYGNIAFDGNGKYTINNTQVFDSNSGVPQNFTVSGTYSISASGYGFLSSPISQTDFIYGLVSKGIFIGTSTEAGYNDLMIAAQVPSPTPTASFFQGAYTMLQMDFPTGVPTDTRQSQFQLNPDGNGNIGTVQFTGNIASRGTAPVTQNNSGVRYIFSNGAASVNFGGTLSNSNLLAGTKYLYFSTDGEFVFGGSPTGYDMIVGVKNRAGSPNFSGTYYQGGLFQDESTLAEGYADLYTYYGSFKANSGALLSHQRILNIVDNNAYDLTKSDSYTLRPDNTYEDVSNRYLFGTGGAIRIGIGKFPALGVSVAVQAPTFAPNGVFIDPTGVVNAASSSMFTSGIAPGQLISIYGTNLAADTQVDATFPVRLGGVQVLINNRPAPIYVVSPTQISAVVPFATLELIANIQVVNNGIASNTVSVFGSLTAPGVFTQPPGGIGYAAALRTNYSVVSKTNPVQVGEAISLFVTGLGIVKPEVADGSPGPTDPFSLTSNTITVFIGGKRATTTFVGLAPQLVGLYQINVIVPEGVPAGDAKLDLSGPDSYNTQALIPIG